MGRMLKYLQALLDLLFGYDFFVSYAHDDGYNYPRELTNQLEQKGFKVFLDSREYIPGDDLQIATRRRIRMSKKLVVIARPIALQSQWVLKEVKISLQSGRVPIVIDINATIENANEASAVKNLLEDKLHIRESLDNLDATPSSEALSELTRSFSATRQETKRLRFVSAIAVLLFLLAGAAIWQYQIAEGARIQAEQQRDLAQGRELAAQSLAEGAADPELGVLLALESMRISPTEQAEKALRKLLPDLYAKGVLTGQKTQVLSARFSSSGNRIVTAGGDKIARIYEADTRQLLHELKGHDSIISNAVFSPDESKVVTASEDHTARIWHTETGDLQATLQHQYWVFTAQFSSDGRRVVTSELINRNQVRSYFWDALTGEKLQPLGGFDGYVSDNGRWLLAIENNQLAVRDTLKNKLAGQLNVQPGSWMPGGISADGRLLAFATSTHGVEVWDSSKGKRQHQFNGHDANVSSVAFSENNDWLATASDDFTARLWSLTNKKRFILRGHNDRITALAFSPDNRWLATASTDKTIRLWDVLSGRPVAQMRGHRDKVVAVEFHPNQPLLLTAGDNNARLWRVTNEQTMRRFANAKNGYHHASLSPNNTLLVAAGIAQPDLWGAKTGVKISQISGHSSIPVNVDFHPQGQFFAVASFDGQIQIGDAARDKIVSAWRGHNKPIYVARFNPTGELLVSAGADNIVRLWKRGKKDPLLIYRGHTNTVKEAVFSADGKTIASGDYDGQVHFWSVKTGEPITEPDNFPSKILRLLFHPTEDLLLVAMTDNLVQLYSRSSQIRRILDHPEGFSGAAFTPDGNYLMTGNQQNHLTLWDLKTAQPISNLRIADGPLSFADLSDDGKWLLTIEADKAVRLYPWELLAPADDLIKITKQRLDRSLSNQEKKVLLNSQAVSTN